MSITLCTIATAPMRVEWSSAGHTVRVKTVEYAPGRLADVYGSSSGPTVLLWHGMQTDSRAAVGPLSGLLAGRGANVVAPDWNSHARDGGRADLLASLDLARTCPGADDGIVLVGWSLGGTAAAGLALCAARFKVVLAHTVCLAGAFMAADPISGRRVTDSLSAYRAGSPLTLLHGMHDDMVPVTASRDFAARLLRAGRPVDVVELDADHGSIAGAVYDRATDRFAAAEGGRALDVAGEVAARIAATFGR